MFFKRQEGKKYPINYIAIIFILLFIGALSEWSGTVGLAFNGGSNVGSIPRSFKLSLPHRNLDPRGLGRDQGRSLPFPVSRTSLNDSPIQNPFSHIPSGGQDLYRQHDEPRRGQTWPEDVSNAFKMADDGGKMIGEGMRMNNQVATDAGAIEKFAQGNQVIETGINTMAQGAQFFLKGENIYLKK